MRANRVPALAPSAGLEAVARGQRHTLRCFFCRAHHLAPCPRRWPPTARPSCSRRSRSTRATPTRSATRCALAVQGGERERARPHRGECDGGGSAPASECLVPPSTNAPRARAPGQLHGLTEAHELACVRATRRCKLSSPALSSPPPSPRPPSNEKNRSRMPSSMPASSRTPTPRWDRAFRALRWRLARAEARERPLFFCARPPFSHPTAPQPTRNQKTLGCLRDGHQDRHGEFALHSIAHSSRRLELFFWRRAQSAAACRRAAAAFPPQPQPRHSHTPPPTKKTQKR